MRARLPRRSALIAAAGVALVSAGLTAAATGTGTVHAAAASLPDHVFAPYFEAYNGDNPVALSQESGAKYLTFAFIQTAASGSCTAYWNGDTSQPISSSTFGSDVATIQADGGNVIPSFGGESADSTGTDIADSCTSVSSIAQVYEKVITTYNVSRLDLDIEQKSLADTAGINRRNEAVAKTEAWAAANGRSIQFSYTMPATTTGMDPADKAVVKNAIADGARISVVNLMTFDYYIGTKQEMATDTETAGSGLHNQLKSLYPSDSSAQLWRMVGVTVMPGIDDYGSKETFTKADAATVLKWAQANGISTLSFWALQRDNGGCVGTKGSDTCSGISQPTWFFSHAFEPFTSGGRPA
jgi:Glycosyl hydrolases family 18